MTDNQLDMLAAELPLIKQWVEGVERILQERLENGTVYSNVKLVPTRATRKWGEGIDPITLLSKFADLDKVAPRNALSPAQSEKILGKVIYKDNLSEHVVQESSGMTLNFID